MFLVWEVEADWVFLVWEVEAAKTAVKELIPDNLKELKDDIMKVFHEEMCQAWKDPAYNARNTAPESSISELSTHHPTNSSNSPLGNPTIGPPSSSSENPTVSLPSSSSTIWGDASQQRQQKQKQKQKRKRESLHHSLPPY